MGQLDEQSRDQARLFEGGRMGVTRHYLVDRTPILGRATVVAASLNQQVAPHTNDHEQSASRTRERKHEIHPAKQTLSGTGEFSLQCALNALSLPI